MRLWVEINCSCGIFFSLRVSLFVRLWVEIRELQRPESVFLSASSWGCELKSPRGPCGPTGPWSASSWGCELKYIMNEKKKYCKHCQPLREAVSWNMASVFSRSFMDLSASSWGCELKYSPFCSGIFGSSQPLREAVSWNVGNEDWLNYVWVSLFVRLWVEI